MELSIKDRLYIPGFLPKENNFKQFNIKNRDFGRGTCDCESQTKCRKQPYRMGYGKRRAVGNGFHSRGNRVHEKCL